MRGRSGRSRCSATMAHVTGSYSSATASTNGMPVRSKVRTEIRRMRGQPLTVSLSDSGSSSSAFRLSGADGKGGGAVGKIKTCMGRRSRNGVPEDDVPKAFISFSLQRRTRCRRVLYVSSGTDNRLVSSSGSEEQYDEHADSSSDASLLLDA